MFSEIDFQKRELDATGINRFLERQLHPVGLTLHAVEQYAGDGFVLSRHPSLFGRIYGPGKRGWENLVTSATSRLQADPGNETPLRFRQPHLEAPVMKAWCSFRFSP